MPCLPPHSSLSSFRFVRFHSSFPFSCPLPLPPPPVLVLHCRSLLSDISLSFRDIVPRASLHIQPQQPWRRQWLPALMSLRSIPPTAWAPPSVHPRWTGAVSQQHPHPHPPLSPPSATSPLCSKMAFDCTLSQRATPWTHSTGADGGRTAFLPSSWLCRSTPRSVCIRAVSARD